MGTQQQQAQYLSDHPEIISALANFPVSGLSSIYDIEDVAQQIVETLNLPIDPVIDLTDLMWAIYNHLVADYVAKTGLSTDEIESLAKFRARCRIYASEMVGDLEEQVIALWRADNEYAGILLGNQLRLENPTAVTAWEYAQIKTQISAGDLGLPTLRAPTDAEIDRAAQRLIGYARGQGYAITDDRADEVALDIWRRSNP